MRSLLARCCVCARSDDIEVMRGGRCRDCWDCGTFKCQECRRVIVPILPEERAEARISGLCCNCAVANVNGGA